MSAVRMVAYGVLELKGDRVRDNERLYKLVREELGRYGLTLFRPRAEYSGPWRKKAQYALYGQLQGTLKFTARSPLYTGSFKDCCIEAAKLLDQLDAAQIPDTATGNE